MLSLVTVFFFYNFSNNLFVYIVADVIIDLLHKLFENSPDNVFTTKQKQSFEK